MKAKNLLDNFRKIVNPPYSSRDMVGIFITVFLLIIIPLTTLAVVTNRQPVSRAVASASISLLPSSQSVNHGDSLTIEIRENSGTEPVNAVEADLSYDANKLTLDSVDYTGSAFEIQAEETLSTGSIEIVRGTVTAKTGDQLVARLNFTAKSGASGDTTVSFVAGTRVVSSNTNTDILVTQLNGTYTIVDPPPTVNITSPANNQMVSKTITVTATANDDLAVTKVEFRVDGTLKRTDTAAPYNYSLDTTTLTNTTHIVQARAYDANNFTNDQINISVDNQPPTAPTGFTGLTISETQINLSWNTSTDNIGVFGYDLYRDGLKINSSLITTTSYEDKGLVAGTTHSYFVKAIDGQGNTSPASDTISVKTSKKGDFNNDGVVDVFDLSLLLSSWETDDPSKDLNNDGIVDVFDFSILLSNWDG